MAKKPTPAPSTFRWAPTGRYVTETCAEKHPKTTVKEMSKKK